MDKGRTKTNNPPEIGMFDKATIEAIKTGELGTLYIKYKDKPLVRFCFACNILNRVLRNDKKGFGYKYCDLNQVLSRIYEIFPYLGLFVFQKIDFINFKEKEVGHHYITTKVIDISKEGTDKEKQIVVVESCMKLPDNKELLLTELKAKLDVYTNDLRQEIEAIKKDKV